MNLSVSILMSVATKVSARQSLHVKILMEATPVNVIKVLEVISAKILMNAPKSVLVMRMQHV